MREIEKDRTDLRVVAGLAFAALLVAAVPAQDHAGFARDAVAGFARESTREQQQLRTRQVEHPGHRARTVAAAKLGVGGLGLLFGVLVHLDYGQHHAARTPGSMRGPRFRLQPTARFANPIGRA